MLTKNQEPSFSSLHIALYISYNKIRIWNSKNCFLRFVSRNFLNATELPWFGWWLRERCVLAKPSSSSHFRSTIQSFLKRTSLPCTSSIDAFATGEQLLCRRHTNSQYPYMKQPWISGKISRTCTRCNNIRLYEYSFASTSTYFERR